jgi:diguanylate cyclase (GGDEF)-like protein
MLIAFSKLMRSHLRNHDIIVRYGGDEFVAILPNTAPSQAFVVAEKLRTLVEESIFQTKQGPMRFTISIGIAMWQLSHTSIDSTIRQADVALYQSKEAGRNRTVLLHTEQP